MSSKKGKERATDISNPEENEQSDSESTSETSDSDSSSDSSESENENTQEYLDSLLQKVLRNAKAAEKRSNGGEDPDEEDVIVLKEKTLRPLPPLDPGKLPAPYIRLGATRFESILSIRDPEIERTQIATASISAPAPPVPPPELTKSGKPLTKKEMKELKQKTAGPSWFDLPAASEADLPRLHREVEALRLRNQLDPKRFYRKDEGEGKGIKGLPKYFAIGTILPTSTPFGTSTSDNLSRPERKRTLVDELVDDAEAKRYAKKKFGELQAVRGAKGKNTLRAKQALRKPKW